MTSSPLKIAFNKLQWEEVGLHSRQKSISTDDTIFRLLELSPGFIEPDWCHKGHRGFVVSGVLSIEFENEVIKFQAGDALNIATGEATKHKALISDDVAVLFLIESTEA